MERGPWKWKGEGKGKLTPQVGTASRADVQFFAPVRRAGGAVIVCDEVSAALITANTNCVNFMLEK